MFMDSDEVLWRFGSLCDSFAKTIEEARAEWKPDAPPLTLVMCMLGRSLTSRAQPCTETEFKGVFDLVEVAITQGEESVQNAIATGFLESLQSESDAGRFDFRSVAHLLGQETVNYCRAWDSFTGCNTRGLD